MDASFRRKTEITGAAHGSDVLSRDGNDMNINGTHSCLSCVLDRGIRIAFLCGLFLMVSSPASGIEGLPGSTWGNLSHSVQGLTGSSAMGWINQGIDWTTLPGDITFNTYVEYRYRARTKQKEYYNAQGPAIGLEFKKSYFRLGADYYQQRFPKLGETSYNREVYLNGFYDWDLSRPGRSLPLGIVGFPGAVWGNETYFLNGLTGSGVMGWINQGIDWITLPGGIIFNTYVEYRYRARTKQREYYDAEGPAVGLEFKKASFRLGMDYYWEQFPKLGEGEHSHSLEYYLIWYLDWDLLRSKKE
jgi:hypothetical protein